MITAESLRRIPWTIVFCTVALMGLGLSGIARCDSLQGGKDFYPQQVVWVVSGLVLMFLASSVNYRIYARYGMPLFALAILLLVCVLFCPAIKGAKRWIPLPFFKLQPSEMAKLTFIMALAGYLRYRENYRRLRGLLFPFVMALVPLSLILIEPNLSTALLFLPVLYAMLFAAGARLRHLLSLALLGVAVLPFLWFGMSAEQQSRITALFQQRDGGHTPNADSYHLHKSKLVLALGGIWGSQFSGDAVDDPSAYRLPEGHTDFILCFIGERWGLIGCLTMLAIYLVLFARGLMIAVATREPFGRLLAVGIVALLATQTIVNAGVTVGLVPTTGQTLPLASYGGASLLVTSLALGLLLNVGMRRGYEMTGEPFRFTDS